MSHVPPTFKNMRGEIARRLVADWVADFCTTGNRQAESTDKSLFHAFRHSYGIMHPLSSHDFLTALKAQGFKLRKVGTSKVFTGIMVTPGAVFED